MARKTSNASNNKLKGTAKNDVLKGLDGRDNLLGQDGGDNLDGGNHNDTVDGGNGNDALFGGKGNDKLYGGAGDDKLTGGYGQDILTGGEGRDTFVFTSALDSKKIAKHHDIITDFMVGEDQIDLSKIDTNLARKGNQDFTFLGEGVAFTGNKGDLTYRHIEKNGQAQTVLEADLNGDTKADFTIVLKDKLTLTALDFIL